MLSTQGAIQPACDPAYARDDVSSRLCTSGARYLAVVVRKEQAGRHNASCNAQLQAHDHDGHKGGHQQTVLHPSHPVVRQEQPILHVRQWTPVRPTTQQHIPSVSLQHLSFVSFHSLHSGVWSQSRLIRHPGLKAQLFVVCNKTKLVGFLFENKITTSCIHSLNSSD